MDPKESCCTALCFLCNPGSSLHSSSLRPPRKCGGLSKLVQSSSEWPADLWSLLLWLLLCLPLAGGLEVEMAGKTQMVFLHEDVTIPCKIPGSPKLDLNTVGVIWSLKKDRDESEVQVFEFYGDQREAVRPGADVSLLGLEHGNASLHLPRIELWEAGEYRCKVVVTPEKAEGTTRLEVVAHPDMCLFEKLATARNGKEKLIICQLEGFYPEAFDIKWMRCALKDSHFQEITEGIVTGPTVKNVDDTFSVNSSLVLKPALEDHIYQCVVSHRSWLIPQSLNITIFENKPGSVMMYVTIIGSCIVLFSVIACGLWKWKRLPTHITEPVLASEGRGEAGGGGGGKRSRREEEKEKEKKKKMSADPA
ncbi:natural cytotoxicity triggering receptor 3 ligand 1-like isoform X2 [Apodemus sylvaticus]|uniref:natural cytotoxicity triggering receptor 3 ligand 1-like isoform X2 n=1 Tax=Apodemus sylvaticus TaxID=10129 RepID=UPI0022423BD7|nr:natural cytotoxicity triggering receptor 3 ligand 1-like isoform X2 [Apodemus sylvaticus]XP_052017892.1 natural cytotoxicity triggering receptor 3 ligand 1-like isoform X2 [Apodemus sylvaticus]